MSMVRVSDGTFPELGPLQQRKTKSLAFQEFKTIKRKVELVVVQTINYYNYYGTTMVVWETIMKA